MRQLANGLMGNEGPSAGSRWLDAELNSVYCVLTMLHRSNMLFSKCDSVNMVKPGIPKTNFIRHSCYCCMIGMVRQCHFKHKCSFAAHSAQFMPKTSYSNMHLHTKLQNVQN